MSSRLRISIRTLSSYVDLQVPELIDLLREDGISVRSERSGLTRADFKAARRLCRDLGIDCSFPAQFNFRSKADSAVTKSTFRQQSGQVPVPKASVDVAPKSPPTKNLDLNESSWPQIGSVETINLLTPEEVNSIHWAIVNYFRDSRDTVDPPGVRDENLLHSSVHRPSTAFGSEKKYPTVSMAGAALFHTLVLNHPFHNGNKRTAIVALFEFLRRNSYKLETELGQEALYRFVVDVAAHRFAAEAGNWQDADSEVLGISRWIQQHTRRVQKGEQNLQFGQLRKLLKKHGCVIEVIPGSKVNIRRNGKSCQLAYGGEGRDCDKASIHRIRKRLLLDESNGYDSDTFYSGGEPTQGFIKQYEDLLAKLARV